MNYLDLIGKAQGGMAYSILGNRFGLSADQTASAARYIIPALSESVRRNAASPEGLCAILKALGSGRHERYYDDPGIFMDSEARKDGDGILGHILGNPEIRGAIADNAAKNTGISAIIIDQMMPYLAMMFMGSMIKRTREPLDNLASSIAGNSGSNPLASIMNTSNTNIFGTLASFVGNNEVDENVSSIPANLADSFTKAPGEENATNGVGGFLGSMFNRK